MSACLPRSKSALASVLDSLDVEHHPEWQPNHEGHGWTYCNQAAKAACDALESELPALIANQQGEWLDSPAGRLAGWEECTAARAGDRAELGFPTVVTLHEEGHGHIAVVRGRDEHQNLRLWQAGRTNFNDGPLRSAFTVEQLQRVKFFTHA